MERGRPGAIVVRSRGTRRRGPIGDGGAFNGRQSCAGAKGWAGVGPDRGAGGAAETTGRLGDHPIGDGACQGMAQGSPVLERTGGGGGMFLKGVLCVGP